MPPNHIEIKRFIAVLNNRLMGMIVVANKEGEHS